MNLFPQRGEYLDCNFLNAASGSLVTPRVRRLKRNPLDKKGFFDLCFAGSQSGKTRTRSRQVFPVTPQSGVKKT